jgi:hypothetical protein
MCEAFQEGGYSSGGPTSACGIHVLNYIKYDLNIFRSAELFIISDNVIHFSMLCQVFIGYEAPAKVLNRHVIWGKKKGIYPMFFW